MTAFGRIALAILVTLATALSHPARAEEAATPDKPLSVAIQVNEGESAKWHNILVNVRNMQHDAGTGGISIAVIAIGPGLDMLMADSLAANDVQDAMARGVEFIACENTMHARNITRADLIDGIGYAKAGYLELARRQQAGWTYLRP